MRFSRLALLGATCAVLGGCQSVENTWTDLTSLDTDSMTVVGNEERRDAEIVTPCPDVRIVDELSSLSEFTDMKRPAKDKLVSRVDLSQAESSCSFQPGYVALDLKLAFEGHLGPNAKGKSSDKPFYSYPFFVAVTDREDTILAKEIFAASMTYERNETDHTTYENLKQLIPIDSDTEARNYKVLLGFQLSPKQLSYNKKNMVPVKTPPAPVPLRQDTPVMQENSGQSATIDDVIRAHASKPDRKPEAVPVDITR